MLEATGKWIYCCRSWVSCIVETNGGISCRRCVLNTDEWSKMNSVPLKFDVKPEYVLSIKQRKKHCFVSEHPTLPKGVKPNQNILPNHLAKKAWKVHIDPCHCWCRQSHTIMACSLKVLRTGEIGKSAIHIYQRILTWNHWKKCFLPNILYLQKSLTVHLVIVFRFYSCALCFRTKML